METAVATTGESLPSLPDNTSGKHKDIPIADIIEFKAKGLTHQQIADLVGCSKTNVTERLQTVTQEIDSVKNFKKHRADTFAVIGHRLINSLTPEVIKEMSGLQMMTAAGIAYDKERLERDLSTENVSHDVLIGTASDKRKAYEEAVRMRLEGEG